MAPAGDAPGTSRDGSRFELSNRVLSVGRSDYHFQVSAPTPGWDRDLDPRDQLGGILDVVVLGEMWSGKSQFISQMGRLLAAKIPSALLAGSGTPWSRTSEAADTRDMYDKITDPGHGMTPATQSINHYVFHCRSKEVFRVADIFWSSLWHGGWSRLGILLSGMALVALVLMLVIVGAGASPVALKLVGAGAVLGFVFALADSLRRILALRRKGLTEVVFWDPPGGTIFLPRDAVHAGNLYAFLDDLRALRKAQAGDGFYGMCVCVMCSPINYSAEPIGDEAFDGIRQVASDQLIRTEDDPYAPLLVVVNRSKLLDRIGGRQGVYRNGHVIVVPVPTSDFTQIRTERPSSRPTPAATGGAERLPEARGSDGERDFHVLNVGRMEKCYDLADRSTDGVRTLVVRYDAADVGGPNKEEHIPPITQTKLLQGVFPSELVAWANQQNPKVGLLGLPKFAYWYRETSRHPPVRVTARIRRWLYVSMQQTRYGNLARTTPPRATPASPSTADPPAGGGFTG